MFKAPFSFNGRITRAEYTLSFFIGNVLFNIGIMLMAFSGMAWFMLVLVAVWFWSAQGTKRCHDFGYNGWIQVIPIINPFALLLVPGNNGFNRYGANPRGAVAPVMPAPGPPTLSARPPMSMASTYVPPPIKVASFCCSSCGAQNKDVPYTQSPQCEYCGSAYVKK